MGPMVSERPAFSPLDRLLSLADEGLKVVFPGIDTPRAGEQAPAPASPPAPLSPAESREAAALMRVNHAGEVCAQALYQGQALLARDEATRRALLTAAREEGDHLAWCAERLAALGSHPSRLNAVWYLGSVAIGAGAALLGDAASLGFLAETERQVESHLSDHLARLPPGDTESRAVLERMRADEVRHGEMARARGARELPAPAIGAMRLASSFMKRIASSF
jgi:3-demethoxyubiquinol 3-hydroxylase